MRTSVMSSCLTYFSVYQVTGVRPAPGGEGCVGEQGDAGKRGLKQAAQRAGGAAGLPSSGGRCSPTPATLNRRGRLPQQQLRYAHRAVLPRLPHGEHRGDAGGGQHAADVDGPPVVQHHNQRLGGVLSKMLQCSAVVRSDPGQCVAQRGQPSRGGSMRACMARPLPPRLTF